MFKDNKPVIMVDIDNTLWQFDKEWHKELLKINSNCPKPGTDGNWNFFEGFMTWDEAVKAATNVHIYQYEYKAWPHASKLTRAICEAGYNVVIASHRDEITIGATFRWLSEQNIAFNSLYVGWNKAELFENNNVVLVIDDSPVTLKKALSKGIDCMAIEYEYNRAICEATLCKDDKMLYEKVLEWINKNKKEVQLSLFDI